MNGFTAKLRRVAISANAFHTIGTTRSAGEVKVKVKVKAVQK
jgi:hypothetical protein